MGGYDWLSPCKAPGDMVICADGGIRHAEALGLIPDLVVGDFDSYGYRDFPCETQVFQSEKDDTDMLIAIKAGLAAGYRSFALYGGLGGRLDHTVANLQHLLYLSDHNAQGCLLDAKNEAFIIDKSRMIPRKKGYKLSFFSADTACCGVSLRGVKYPLAEATLTNAFPLGVSNEFAGDRCEVSLRSGRLLCILSKD